jgi:hypothetical protein
VNRRGTTLDLDAELERLSREAKAKLEETERAAAALNEPAQDVDPIERPRAPLDAEADAESTGGMGLGTKVLLGVIGLVALGLVIKPFLGIIIGLVVVALLVLGVIKALDIYVGDPEDEDSTK